MSNKLKQVRMKSLKLLLFTLICTFASPVLPAFAIIAKNDASGQEKLVKKHTHFTKKQLLKFPINFLSLFDFNRISPKDAIIKGSICLVLSIACLLYAPIRFHPGILGIFGSAFLWLMAIGLGIYTLYYAIVLVVILVQGNS